MPAQWVMRLGGILDPDTTCAGIYPGHWVVIADCAEATGFMTVCTQANMGNGTLDYSEKGPQTPQRG